MAPTTSPPASGSGSGSDSASASSPVSSSSGTLHADLTSLNNQLLSHGWAKRPLTLNGLSERDTSDVVAVLYELVGSATGSIDNLDALAARFRTLEYENERVLKALTTSRTSQRKAELDAMGWRTRVLDLERRLGLEEGKCKELREEVGRGRKAVESVRIAAGHEQKKMQSKVDQLQAKMTRYCSDAEGSALQQGLAIFNPVFSMRGVPMAIGQAPLLEQSLRDLAEIREGLQEENEGFRHVVVAAGNALREAVAMSHGEPEPSRLGQAQFFILPPNLRLNPSSSSPSSSLTSPTFPEIANARLLSLISSARSRLTEKIIRIPFNPSEEGEGQGVDPEEAEAKARAIREEEKRLLDLKDRVKDLEVELGIARGREEEVRGVVQAMTARQMAESMAKASERDQDAHDLLEILKERERLEQERRQVRELQDGFSRERRRFEHERQAFLDERRRVDVDSILAQLPSTPSSAAPPVHLPSARVSDGSLGSSGSTGAGAEADSESSQSPSSSGSSVAAPAPNAFNINTNIPKRRSSIPHQHIPSSPSPLSPHRPMPRTPKTHLAGLGAKGKRTRTPLSRLVLEKAVRQRSAEGGQRQGQGQEHEKGKEAEERSNTGHATAAAAPAPVAAAARAVLGEGSGKVNAGGSLPPGVTERRREKGKEKGKESLQKSTTSGHRSGSGSGSGSHSNNPSQSTAGAVTASSRIKQKVIQPLAGSGSMMSKKGAMVMSTKTTSSSAKPVWR